MGVLMVEGRARLGTEMRNQEGEVWKRRQPSLRELQRKLFSVRTRFPVEQKERGDTQRRC